MKSNRHLEDDDLAFFAMGSLNESDTAAVQLQLTASAEDRFRLGEVQARLGAYAEAMVPLQAIPDGSLERMLQRIAQQKQVVPISRVAVKPPPALPATRPRQSGLPTWIGWGLAASLALTVGKLYQDRASLRADLTSQAVQAAQMSARDAETSRERDALRTRLAEQAKKTEELATETASAQKDSETLSVTVAGQSAKLRDQTTQVASAEAERDRLRTTVTIQASQAAQQTSQVAQLTTDAAQARQIMEALSDRTALRVTLTKPKSRPAPTARATYVASRGTFVFLANDLAPLKANKVYQLWLMPADGSKPIPEGTFVPDARGSASLVYAQLPRPASAKGFGVTVENAGGSETPTSPIVLAGSAGL